MDWNTAGVLAYFKKKLVFSDVGTKVPPFRGICVSTCENGEPDSGFAFLSPLLKSDLNMTYL